MFGQGLNQPSVKPRAWYNECLYDFHVFVCLLVFSPPVIGNAASTPGYVLNADIWGMHAWNASVGEHERCTRKKVSSAV